MWHICMGSKFSKWRVFKTVCNRHFMAWWTSGPNPPINMGIQKIGIDLVKAVGFASASNSYGSSTLGSSYISLALGSSYISHALGFSSISPDPHSFCVNRACRSPPVSPTHQSSSISPNHCSFGHYGSLLFLH